MRKNIQMNSGGTGNEAPMEANHKMHNGPNDIKGVDVKRQGILEEDETKLNELTEDVKMDHGGDIVLLDYETIVQKQPPPPPLGPIVHWERFLPVRSLNVLLVENDDSTRQVVSALLRNCSYEVTAAADALQAWRILEDFTNRVDLVLTEVAMPVLSGVGLLCKIMSHRTCKNIPVIMMSSNDSVGTVFKCLSKGAVDFLVKPIRKNELKNLWQHVWRRCHSSSGSGSESGIQHQKSTKSKSPDDSDDDTDSNVENGNASFGLNLRDGSDNVSGTQSSWTKHAVEDDSPHQVSPPPDSLADPYDSICVQVVHSKHNIPNSPNKECQEQEEVADKNSVGKDLKMGAPRNPDREHKPHPTEKPSSVTGASLEKLRECDSKMEINEIVPGPESSNASCGPISQVADLIGGIADNSEAHLAFRVPETRDGFSKISKCKDNTNEDFKELPTFDLSLKRLRSGGDGGDHNILRHSDLSAFSRYNSPATTSQAPRGHGAICSNPPDISEEIKTESTCSMLNAVTLKKGLIACSNNNDMASTTKDAFTKLSAHKEKITSISTAKTIYPSLHHMAHRPSANQLLIQEKVDDVTGQAMAGQPIGLHHEIQVQHHHHHYHHYHHHVHSMQQQQEPPPDHDDISLKDMASTALQCGSSNMYPESMEINALNYSLNGSASGSNHISNGHNGSSKAVNTGAMNMESDTAVVTNSETGGTNVVDQNRFSQREAALNKFRQKRKERNFGKKVRYQSRKKLAEQRPRVRGQFVRRTTHDHTSREGSS